MDIAPLPGATLEGLHNRMATLLEVLIGMLTGGRIAAADIPAAQTLAQLHPALASFDALLATLGFRRDGEISLGYVFTLRHESSNEKSLDELTA
jgi:hypothetical protein